MKTQKNIVNNSLVYYKKKADTNYWDDHWSSFNANSVYVESEQGGLGWFARCFTTYLPKDGLILEAGCGLGQHVLALDTLGYHVEGIDWACKTVQSINKKYPYLNVRQCDATNIDVEDGHYKAYISIGVIEHRYDGPEPFLTEAYRVLSADGIAIFTVPCFNKLRQIKAQCGMYKASGDGSEFYQFAFSRETVSRYLNNAGFVIKDYWGYDSYKCFAEEIGLVKYMTSFTVGKYHIGSVLQKILSRTSFIENTFGHMQLLVCTKTK